jgi:hypothetical protein
VSATGSESSAGFRTAEVLYKLWLSPSTKSSITSPDARDHVSLRESSHHLLLLRGGNREVCRKKTGFQTMSLISSTKNSTSYHISTTSIPQRVQRTRLTPPFVAKAPTIDRLAADLQIAFAHDCRIKAIALDFVNSLSYEVDFRF